MICERISRTIGKILSETGVAMCFFLLNGSIPKGLRAIKNSANVLYSEAKLKPYWDLDLHLSSSLAIIGHVLRCLNHLAHAAFYTFSVGPVLFFSPFEIPLLPVVIAEHLFAATISALTAAVQPIFFVLRTLSSMIFGYQEHSELDWGSSEAGELDDWKASMNPFIP